MTRYPLAALVVVVLVLSALACSPSDDSNAQGPTSELTNADGGTPPTPEATTADEAFRAVPRGYTDCGTANLTSGWPTTAVYTSDSAQCIVDAASSGDPSHYTYYGRDNKGGIDGTIVQVNGTDSITMVDYHVEPDGVIDSNETTCSRLTAPSFTPPVCKS